MALLFRGEKKTDFLPFNSKQTHSADQNQGMILKVAIEAVRHLTVSCYFQLKSPFYVTEPS